MPGHPKPSQPFFILCMFMFIVSLMTLCTIISAEIGQTAMAVIYGIMTASFIIIPLLPPARMLLPIFILLIITLAAIAAHENGGVKLAVTIGTIVLSILTLFFLAAYYISRRRTQPDQRE